MMIKYFQRLAIILILSSFPLEARALDHPHNKVIGCSQCHQTPSASWWTDQGAAGGLCGQCHYPGSPNRDAVTHQPSGVNGGSGLLCTQCHNPHYQKQFRTWKQDSYLATGTISAAGPAALTRVERSPAWSEDQWKGMLLVPNLRYPQYNYRILSNSGSTITIDTAAGDAINTSVALPGSVFAVTYGRLIKESLNGRAVRFFQKTGGHSFADPDATADGVCQVCHGKTSSFTADGILEGPAHPMDQAGRDCTYCHSHQAGFEPQCGACHGSPPSAGTLGGPNGLANNEGGTGSATPGAHDKHAVLLGFGCTTCHSGGMPDTPVYDKKLQIGFSIAGGVSQSGQYDGRTSLANGYGYAPGNPGTTVTAGGTMTCSNVYCHGSTMAPNNGTNITPAWDTPSPAACGTCHGATADAPPLRGSHQKHAGRQGANIGLDCAVCHDNDTSAHVNGSADLAFSADPRAAGGGYSGTPAMLDAYGSCSTVYCHSNAQSSPPGGAVTYSTPAWGGTAGCGSCHKGDAAHTSSSNRMDSGSHARHLDYSLTLSYTSMRCAACHKWNTTNTLAEMDADCSLCHLSLYPLHADGQIHVFMPARFGGTYSGSPSPGDAYGSCSNTYCHSNGTAVATTVITDNTTAQWGVSGPLPCNSCHGSNGDISGRPAYANAGPKANSHQSPKHLSLGCDKCHSTTTTTGTTISSTTAHVNKLYDVSGTGAGPYSLTYAYNASGGSCSNAYCHGNYPGSGKNATPAWGNASSGACGTCHGASNTAAPDSGGHFLHADATVHNYACTLCHMNVAGGSGPDAYSLTGRDRHTNGMVDWQFDAADPKVSATSSYTIASGSQSPSDGTTPRSYGTCSKVYCHSIAQTSTGGPLTGAAGEYATTPRWGPGSGSYFCGTCHKNGSSHNYGNPAPMDSGSHAKHLAYRFTTLVNSNGASMKCAICHKYDAAASFNTCGSCHGDSSSAALYSGHANGVINVAFEPVFGAAASYNDTNAPPGAPGNGFFTCSNTYCHSSGTSVSTGAIPENTAPTWGASGPLPCDACHGAGGDGFGRPDYPTTSPKANSHQAQKHASLGCDACHYSTTTTGTTIASTTTHVNKSYDVNGDGSLLSSFTYAYNAGGGTCSNGYCHSKGTSPATGVIEPGATPGWGAAFPMACDQWTGQSCITAGSGCHQYGYIYVSVPPSTLNYKSCSVCHGANTPGALTKGSYPSNPHKCYGCHRFQPINAPDAPKANSHYTHTFSFPCNYCHYSTTIDGTTIANTVNHANGSYDVVPDPNGLYGGGNVNFTYAFDPGGGICTNINCHITRGIGSWKSWGGAWVNVSSAWKAGPSCYEMIFYNVSASGGTPPYTYLWDFGDGTTSTEQNPTHVFPTGATYNVTVTARDANRHPGTKTAPVTPQPVNAAPVAAMEISVYGWTVTLTDKSYDTDYNTCGHSGPGTIEIMWADYTRTSETIDLTDTPAPRTYTHTYTTANSNAQHFDLIRDNAGVLSQAFKAVAIPTTYTISGRVANAAGTGLNGAVIYLRTMSGAVPPIGTSGLFTDANGNYTFTGTAVDGECYLVKQPIKLGYSFIPAGDQTVCSSNMNVNWTSAP